MCKQRAVSVCPTSEQWAAELRTCAQLLSLCCQWASPGWAHPKGLHWEACTQSDIWTAQEVIIPILWFFFFFNLLPLVLYHSIYFCLCNSQSVFLPLSSLFSLLPWRGPQVVVTRERMMNSSTTEPADSLAAGPSPCSLHPLLTSSPFFFLSPHITSPLISVWQHYWMRELRDTYMCRGESQWTATHHNNLQVINQFWVSQSVNFINENNPRCYSEIQYFVFVFSGMQKAALLFYIQIRATS